MSEENIEKGCINSDRTRCKCDCCEEEMDLDPSWTYETKCPLCEENLFCYICYICQNWACGGSDEPAFPNQPCYECGKTHEEQEEEDVNLYDHKEEKKRVAMGASFREAKTREPMPVYQNNILLTYNALYGRARPGSSPVSESDALRMSEEDWKVLRPVIVSELEDESILTIDWCKYQINVFERSWQQDNMAGLERGTVEDWTGKPYCCFANTTREYRLVLEVYEKYRWKKVATLSHPSSELMKKRGTDHAKGTYKAEIRYQTLSLGVNSRITLRKIRVRFINLMGIRP